MDIGFSVHFQSDGQLFRKELRTYQRVAESIRVMLLAKEMGTFFLVWDNTYSWLTDKTVQYTIHVYEPMEEHMDGLEIEREACRVEINLLQETLLVHHCTVTGFLKRLEACTPCHQKECSQVMAAAHCTKHELGQQIQLLLNINITTLNTLQSTCDNEATELHIVSTKRRHRMETLTKSALLLV